MNESIPAASGVDYKKAVKAVYPKAFYYRTTRKHYVVMAEPMGDRLGEGRLVAGAWADAYSRLPKPTPSSPVEEKWTLRYGSADWGLRGAHEILDGEEVIAIVEFNQPYCMGASRKDIEAYGKQKERAQMMSAAKELYAALDELVAQVRGECPSLLSEDSGGDAELSMEIDAALAKARGGTQ